MTSRTFLVSLLACLFLSPGPAQGEEVRGRVLWDGTPPVPERIPIEAKGGSHSTLGCGLEKISQKLEVAVSGGIRNVVLWVEADGLSSQAAGAHEVVLDQKGCEFSPHVVLVLPGGKLSIRNSDPIRHNLRIFEGPRMLMHAWQPADGADVAWRFEKPGRYLVRCGIHPWMHAWVVAAGHPYYALTDSEGRFAISGLPQGRYTLHLWHEVLGERQQPLELKTQGADLAPIFFSKKEV